MPRFTIYRSDVKTPPDVTEQVRLAGGRVVAARPGLTLIEASDETVRQLRTKLPEWTISSEKTAKMPKPRPKLPPSRKNG